MPPVLHGEVVQPLHPAEVVRGVEGDDGRVGDGAEVEVEQEVDRGDVPLEGPPAPDMLQHVLETADGFGVCCCFDGLLGVLLTIRLVVIKIHCNKYMSRYNLEGL